MGKKLFFQRKSDHHHNRQKKIKEVQLRVISAKYGSSINFIKEIDPVDVASSSVSGGLSSKGRKKQAGARLWMRFDRLAQSELLELDKSAIIKRVSIPARDLRILGPVFSQSSNILAREKATVLNLDFIKAIVTADEVLLPDPLRQEVIPLVHQLQQQLPHKSPFDVHAREKETSSTDHGVDEGHEHELPFEFQVLEIALEVVCTRLDNSMTELEGDAYTILDELTRQVNTRNLTNVRTLKTDLTSLLARVLKVRNEIEHILDDEEHLAHLYLTRKKKQHEALLRATCSNSIATFGDHDVEDMEMLLEAYFMQLDGIRNHLLSIQKLREYIEDTEDYVGIKLDNQRNDLIQFQLILNMGSVASSIDALICGFLSINIYYSPVNNAHGIFVQFVAAMLGSCFLVFLGLLWHARRKGLLTSL